MDRIFAARTVKGIKSALTSMPGGLDELYRQTLERIKQAGDDGTLGMRILSWITHARRPLLVDELRYGLAVEYSDDGEGLEEFDEDNLLLPGSLVDVCAGLVVIDSTSQMVRLVHHTTQEYFDKARLHLFKGVEVDISRACLTYLSYSLDTKLRIVGDRYLPWRHNEVIKIVHEAIQSHPFLDYATHYWFSHVKSGLLAENRDPVFLKVVARFKTSDRILISVDLLQALSDNYMVHLLSIVYRESSPLEIASRLGLEELVAVLDPSTATCLVVDRSLAQASYGGHLNTVKLLLQYGARVNLTVNGPYGGTTTALGMACSGGHLSIAEFLIENGADIDGNHSVDMPPLHNAVDYDEPRTVDLLLKKGVNVNARDAEGRTACHEAARYGSINSARYLLDAGCGLDLIDNSGMTALHYAADYGRYDMISLFLDRGADASAKNGEGKTARKFLENVLERINLDHSLQYRDIKRLVERLRQLEQKSSTSATGDLELSETSSSHE